MSDTAGLNIFPFIYFIWFMNRKKTCQIFNGFSIAGIFTRKFIYQQKNKMFGTTYQTEIKNPGCIFVDVMFFYDQ